MSNNRIILDGCIKQFKDLNEIEFQDSELFELFSLSQIHKNRNLTFENIQNSIVDGSDDGGIDSIMIFMDEEIIESLGEIEDYKFTNKTNTKFIISQCKKEKSFREGTLDKLITTIPVLFNLEQNNEELLKRFNINVVTLAILLREIWTKTVIAGGQISLEYIYTTNSSKIEINRTFEQKVDQLIILTKELFSTNNVSYINYSSVELLELYQKQKANRLAIDFKEQPLAINFGEDGIGYVGTVLLSDYKKFLTSDNNEIREDLFESNVRHFQGNVDVNRKIRETLISEIDRDFWWLNNGITIIAEAPNQVGKKIVIENIQIVNGLQTSYSIFNHLLIENNDTRSVLIKIIVNSDKETIDNIIASTNRQNPVSATLLRATEPIQRNLELFFLNEGYYYDRRKNFYKNQGKPATKIFSIQYTAQTIEAIVLNNPHKARATPTALLKNDTTYKKIFNPNQNFLGYLKCCLLDKKTHNYVLNIDDRKIKDKISNFKLHLSWLVSKILLGKYELDFQEIVEINIENYTKEVFIESINFLIENIDLYLEENVTTNIINIAKNGDFSTFLKLKLEDIFLNIELEES